MKIGDKIYIPVNLYKPKKTKEEVKKLKERVKKKYPKDYIRVKKEKEGYIVYVSPALKKLGKRYRQ